MRALPVIAAIWTSRWNVARLAVACFLLSVFAADQSARIARRVLAEMPDFDYAAEVRSLRLEGRYGEAEVIAQAGLAHVEGQARETLLAEQKAAKDEQQSLLRMAKDVGVGALSGRGDSLERLIGAVAADFFLVGDIRDLVIQGAALITDDDPDEVILALSAVGVVTTLAPEIDWVPSILKSAKRAGALSKNLGEFFIRSVKGRNISALRPVLGDVGAIAKRASPGGAMRLLRHADSPDDLATLARFVDRNADGAAVLHIASGPGIDVLKAGARRGPASLAAAESALLKASRKGPRGVQFLASPAGRALARPHPLLGLIKGVYKGNAADLATRIADRLDPTAWWIIPASGAWVFLELALLARRFRVAMRPRPARA